MTHKSYDVIMVGGGVMGCAIAYHLLRFDDRLRVALIEMDSTYARASTTLSDGNIRVQFNIKENIQMSLYGLEVLARFADEFNRSSATPDRLRRSYRRIHDACVAIGRDPDEVVRSAMVGVLVAETDGELDERVHDQLAMFAGDTHQPADVWLAERRNRWVMGTPEQAWERIRALEAAGAQRIMLQDFLPRDLEMIELIGRIATG